MDTGPATTRRANHSRQHFTRSGTRSRTSSSCCSHTTTSTTPGWPGRSRRPRERGSQRRRARRRGARAITSVPRSRPRSDAVSSPSTASPPNVIDSSEAFWEHIVRNSADFTDDRVLGDGDIVRARGCGYRVVERPGHSVTDTLFVTTSDGVAFVGDHFLAEITSGAEVIPLELPGEYRRQRAAAVPRRAPRQAAGLQLDVLSARATGPTILDHRAADRGATRVPRTSGSS